MNWPEEFRLFLSLDRSILAHMEKQMADALAAKVDREIEAAAAEEEKREQAEGQELIDRALRQGGKS